MRGECETNDGNGCMREAPPDQAPCHPHDPAYAERRKRIASSGGRGKALGTSSLSQQLADVRRQLYEIVGEIREGKITPAEGAVPVQASNAIIRCLSEDRKALIEGEIEDRVRELEERLAA